MLGDKLGAAELAVALGLQSHHKRGFLIRGAEPCCIMMALLLHVPADRHGMIFICVHSSGAPTGFWEKGGILAFSVVH